MENTQITPKVNAAEQKRIKDARATLTSYLEREMYGFKERYLKSYVEYMFFVTFDNKIVMIKKSQYSSLSKYDRRTLEQFNKDKQAQIAELEARKRDFPYTNTLAFINEAIEGYNVKFERLVSALIAAGIRSYPLSIESVGSGTANDFSFLITHKEIQVYARIIFACGAINAPHYRFIITSNKNELHS